MNYKKRDIDNALRIVQLKLKLGIIGAKKRRFDMGIGYSISSCEILGNSDVHLCDTVGCIGGYASIELGGGADNSLLNIDEVGKYARLHKLFYPNGYGRGRFDHWNNLTRRKAVIAIENYLNGKSDPWNGVVPRNKNREYLGRIVLA